MKRHVLTLALISLTLGSTTQASECTLEVNGESKRFDHVAVRSEPNDYSDGEDLMVHCFREPIPENKQSADDIIWFSPDSGQIDIKIAPSGHVTSVLIQTPDLTTNISGMGFGVTFDGQREGDHVTGTITTDETLGDAETAWKVAATLDLELLGR